MDIPAFTKNQKIFLACVAVVLTIFSIAISGFVWIKARELATFETPPPQTTSLLPGLSPTTATSPTSPPLPPLTRFADSEYNFSFSYPKDLKLKKIPNPKDELLAYARQNYNPPPHLSPRPTPSLDDFAPILKKYSIVSAANPSLPLIEVTIVRGSFAAAAANVKRMATAFAQPTMAESLQKPLYYEAQTQRNETAAVFQLPSKGSFYTIAYYPLQSDVFLQLEVQPETFLNYPGEILDSMLTNVNKL